MLTFGHPYTEPFVGYPVMDGFGSYPGSGYAPEQGMCFYDDSFGAAGEDFMGGTCYQPCADEVSTPHAASGMMMYMDSPVSAMGGDMCSLAAYGNLDMTYCPPQEPAYYGLPNLAADCMVGPVKGDLEDDACTYADASTAATTPTMDPCHYPDAVNDGFDLGYAYDMSAPGLSQLEPCPSPSLGATGSYYTPFVGAMNCEAAFSPFQETDSLVNDATIVEIANEIAANVEFLPEKEANGKYSLDKNHPIHCVWRDLNRGHCSWRCRWWENGKRLSKNFNVKRFGEREAMWMAIAMKIRNSTPVERFQLLKEQREAVRNHLELVKQHVDGTGVEAGYLDAITMAMPPMPLSPRKKRQSLSGAKRAQKENWARISWTYVKVPERRAGETSVVCRLCAKTTKCSRSRNLQQAHIMHLLRMHKNPWKKYLDTDGLTKMCRSALDSLYEQQGFTANSEWKLRPGLTPPEPGFDFDVLEDADSCEE